MRAKGSSPGPILLQRRTFSALIRAIVFAVLVSGSLSEVAQSQTVPATGNAGLSDIQPLRPGDIIRLRVWREPDYSGDFAVESNGSAVLPHVGSFSVQGETAESLRSKLVAAYGEVLLNPSISITVLRRVQVIGAVVKPGLYPVEATMSISDAIALAGGPTQAARKNQVRLLRDGQRIGGNLSTDELLATTGIRSGDQIVVPEQSRWTSERMFYTGIAAAISIGLTLLRGW